jgi:hypothetical protein
MLVEVAAAVIGAEEYVSSFIIQRNLENPYQE